MRMKITSIKTSEEKSLIDYIAYCGILKLVTFFKFDMIDNLIYRSAVAIIVLWATSATCIGKSSKMAWVAYFHIWWIMSKVFWRMAVIGFLQWNLCARDNHEMSWEIIVCFLWIGDFGRTRDLESKCCGRVGR